MRSTTVSSIQHGEDYILFDTSMYLQIYQFLLVTEYYSSLMLIYAVLIPVPSGEECL